MLVAALALIGVRVASAATPLVGTFTITAGADPPGSVGSYFRMILPGGTLTGPFIANSSSGASDQTYTYLSPGTDGGLVTGGYQPEPSPAFDGSGNSLAARIISPAGFFGVKFSADTAAVDPQTATAVPAPAISDDGAGNLSGALRAFGASWNNQEFNQGSPKPDGSSPGLTAGPTGTYNAVTGAYTLDWTSLIVGGPFNGFTGKWHLAGTFVPLAPATATRTATRTSTATGTVTPSATATHTTTPSATVTRTATRTSTATGTVTPSATATRTTTPPATATRTATRTSTATGTVTPSATATHITTPPATATRTATPSPTATPASAATPLAGTFTITAGADPPGSVGSYFRMILPGGTLTGPFIANGSSGASDQTYTYLSPGTDGGLVTGGYQPEPSPAFDGLGNSLAARIISPTAFFGPNFSADTAAIDPQTATAVPAPAISDDGAGNLSGDLRAFGASWNNQEFNQGSPKPDGSFPGLTAGPTGTYNAVTGAYTLDWTSLIVGGPFNGFTGKWHLAGTFVPRIPISGQALQLDDNPDPAKRKLKAQSKDLAIGVGAGNGSGDDPTIVGATVRVVSIAGGFDATYTLPAANWALIGKPGDNKGYKYKDSVGPFTSGQLKAGKPGKPGQLKLVAKGSDLDFSLATDPSPVSVYATIGRQQFWSQYGGTTALKAGKSFKGQDAPVPTGDAP